MKFVRLGFFPNDLAMLLLNLNGDEIKALLRFKLEYLFSGAVGMGNNDSDLLSCPRYKRWPQLKIKLLALGIIRIEDGFLRDDDLEQSVQKQRAAREHGLRGADARWQAHRIGGGV